MMLVCLPCRQAIRIMGDPVAADLLFRDEVPACWSCGKGVTVSLEPELEPAVMTTLEIHNLTAEEALAAVNGLGLPAEQNCYSEVLERLFGMHGIKLQGRQHKGMARYYLDSLELRDGTRIFFAPSPRGVCIYRIAPPHRYANEALNG
jgi:hypothetical protein